MKKTKPFLPVGWLLLWSITAVVHNAQGAPAVFTVDTTQSQVTLSGNLMAFSVLSAPFSPQGPGSLTASYGGSVNADVSDTTIQFTGSSLIAAQVNPTPQQPAPGGTAGSAPADYGGVAEKMAFSMTITNDIALRNVGLDLISPVLTLSNGEFDSTSLEFLFSTNVDGTIDYYCPALGESGTAGLAGSSVDAASATASLTMTGNTQILTVPVNMTFTDTSATLNGTTLIMIGQIVATRTVLSPPNINAITVSNQIAMLTVANATTQSQVLVSPDMNHWSALTATVTNVSGLTLFSVPISGNMVFFRVEQ